MTLREGQATFFFPLQIDNLQNYKIIWERDYTIPDATSFVFSVEAECKSIEHFFSRFQLRYPIQVKRAIERARVPHKAV
jgi:hypothetical protein